MREQATGFTSEHTAEFAVSRHLESVLRKDYRDVSVLYVWLSREGGRLAESIHGSDRFKAVALFPRRSKLRCVDDEQILVTINDAVLRAAEGLANYGIPSVAACPLARSFWELSDNSAPLVIAVRAGTAPTYRVNMATADVDPPDQVLATDGAIQQYVQESARELNIKRLMDAVRDSRVPASQSQWFGSGFLPAAYRPLTLLLRQ